MATAQTGSTPGLAIERVPIESVHPDPANARRGDVATIAESLREFGQHRPLVVQRSTDRIVVGNHTYEAAQRLGWKEVDVVYVDDDDAKAVRRGIADNATGDRATWNRKELAALVATTGPVPGFDDREVQKLLDEINAEEEGAPDYPVIPLMDERYSYVVVVATNVVDDTWLSEIFDLRIERQQDFKSPDPGMSRVVSVERFRERIGAL